MGKDLVSTKSSDEGRILTRSYLESRNVMLSDSAKIRVYFIVYPLGYYPTIIDGLSFQIPNAYSEIVLSLEKLPA